MTPHVYRMRKLAELLFQVRALRHYIHSTAGFRHSDGLFVCYGGPEKGHALSKQRLSRWIVEVIGEAHRSSGLPLPLNIKCHSIRSISTLSLRMT